MLLVRDHKGFAVAEALRGLPEVLKNRLTQQRNFAGAVNVAELLQLHLRYFNSLCASEDAAVATSFFVLGKQTT